MHTCELILNLAHAGVAEGEALAELKELEAERDDLEARILVAQIGYQTARQTTAAAVQAVNDYLPCNEAPGAIN